MPHASPHRLTSQDQAFSLRGCPVPPRTRSQAPWRGPTCFAVRARVHDDELGPQLADTPSLEDGHEPAQVLQVESVARAAHLRVILRALHGAVQTLVASRGIADKVSHVVGVWNGGLEAGHGRKGVWVTSDSDRALPGSVGRVSTWRGTVTRNPGSTSESPGAFKQ